VSYHYVQQTRVVPTSGLAIAGFVFALMGFSPLGLILSIAAFGKTRTGERGGQGFAVAGAIIGGLGTLAWLLFIVSVIGLNQAATSGHV
jgi:hypothetical protein